MSFEGYLGQNAQLLADLVSVFTGQSDGAYNGNGSVFNVSVAASSLVQGIQLGMASGEVPVSLVTPNIQLTVTSTLIFASSNIVLTTPATQMHLSSRSIQPKVTLGSNGLQGCGAPNEYAHLSVLQWSVNPYIYETEIKTHQLRLAYTKQVVASDMQSNSYESSQVRENSADFSLTANPAYYVTLQFKSVMKFNCSAISGHQAADTRSLHNCTRPAPVCKTYNGLAYVDCVGCTLSNFTNYNVTFSCSDITQLCPLKSARRRLNDQYSLPSPISTLSYSAFVPDQISSVLSRNPFELNLIVLTFMGSVCGCIIIILIYLLRKDHNEKLYKSYLKSEADNLARKLLKDEIKKGGNGDLGNSYQTQVESLHLTIKSVRTFSSILSRTFSGKVDNHCRHQGATFLGVNFDFDEIESNEFDSDCDDDKSSNEGEVSGFVFENIYGGGNSVHKVEKTRFGIKHRHTKNSGNGRSNNADEAKLAEQVRTTAIVTEFMFKLFPGRSIFIKKKNLWGIVAVQHKYLSMFAASTVTQTRTIQFLNVLSLILTTIFADTVFFGIFSPQNSGCSSMTDKVNHIRRCCATVHSNLFLYILEHLQHVILFF